MDRVLSDFLENPADWLTFLSTLILGLVTVRFAYRSRQLEQKQVRQINREFDLELSEAESEIERARTFVYLWVNNWKANGGSRQALEVYARARSNYTRPDLPKLLKVLRFHLPDLEQDANAGVIGLYATLDYLDVLVDARSNNSAQITEALVRVEQTLAETASQMDRTLDFVKRRRRELRSEA